MEKILITGGNGFIGSHLGDMLAARGNSVTLLDVNFDWHTYESSCNKIFCDVLDYQGLKDAVKTADVIVHLAAVSRVEDGEMDPNRCMSVNLDGTRNVIRVVCEGGKYLIFASSKEVYGDLDVFPVKEESQKRPISTYARSKFLAEQLVTDAGGTKDLRYVITRLSSVFGSLRDRNERVVPTFVRQAFSGEGITIHGGQQLMDFNFVDDVVDVLSLIVEEIRDVIGEDYNIVTGHSVTALELAQLVKRYTGSQSPLIFQNEKEFYVHKFLADPSKINSIIRGKTKLRVVEEGLDIYIQKVLNHKFP